MKKCNVILTGTPRSGTTLACHLLNKLPDTVALHESMKVRKLARWRSHIVICAIVGRFFEETRHSLRTCQTAISKQVNGEIPMNPVEDEPADSTLRRSLASRAEIRISKHLTRDFVLVIKHPAAFTALLETLSKRFPAFAIVRNPLAVLASWNSVQFPVRDGHAPVAEKLDRHLKQSLARIDDRIERQIYLLSWFFERYRIVLPERSILRYEEIVSSGGRALSVITPNASSLDVKLASRNKNSVYDRELMRVLGKKLLETDGSYWAYYSRESVEQLLEE